MNDECDVTVESQALARKNEVDHGRHLHASINHPQSFT